jgi:cell division protein FtsL
VRSQAWIFLIAVLLMGLVATQVSLLKLNAGIGRAVEQVSQLERRNGELRGTISRLSSEGRIQAMGKKLGLVPPEAGRITFLRTRGSGDAAGAAGALRGGRLGANAGAFVVPLPGLRPQAAPQAPAEPDSQQEEQPAAGEQPTGAPEAADDGGTAQGNGPPGGGPAPAAAGTESAGAGTDPGAAAYPAAGAAG